MQKLSTDSLRILIKEELSKKQLKNLSYPELKEYVSSLFRGIKITSQDFGVAITCVAYWSEDWQVDLNIKSAKPNHPITMFWFSKVFDIQEFQDTFYEKLIKLPEIKALQAKINVLRRLSEEDESFDAMLEKIIDELGV